MADRRTRRAQQRQILALLLAIGALVLPIAGAASFGGGFTPNRFIVFGAAGQADMLAPMMLSGSLVLSILVPPARGSGRATPAIVVIAGAILAGVFLGSAWLLNSPEFRVGPASGRYASMAGFVLEAILCAAIAGFAGRLMIEQKQVPVP